MPILILYKFARHFALQMVISTEYLLLFCTLDTLALSLTDFSEFKLSFGVLQFETFCSGETLATVSRTRDTLMYL